jgi:electron transfer flavoprotein beta subunit
MNIVVCISSVPDTTAKINFVENDSIFDENGVQFVINPYDEFGLTKAILLKEKHGGKITVITVGEQKVEPVIRKALAIGADEAIRINHAPKDSYTTAYHIAEYLKINSYDLIITGRESIDYNGGAVGGMIAELLSLPFINACNGLNFSDGIGQITREIDGGKEKLSAKFPLIIGGQKGLVQESELRIPNMRGIMQARTKPLSIIEPSNIENLSTSVKFKKPAEKGACKLVSSDNVGELVSLLQNEAKVI